MWFVRKLNASWLPCDDHMNFKVLHSFVYNNWLTSYQSSAYVARLRGKYHVNTSWLPRYFKDLYSVTYNTLPVTDYQHR